MYSPIIIKSKLDALQNQINLRPKNLQYSLTEFSVEQSRYYTAELDKRLVVTGKVKSIKDLTQVDRNFIENEIYLCQNNFLYWATHYAHVKLGDGANANIGLFKPWISQRIIVDIWAEQEEQFYAIVMLYLKARQLGVSTVNELAIAHRVQFFSRVNALVASSDPDKTKKMAGMMQLCWEMQPHWLLPNYNINTSKELWAVFENNSSVTCQHGTAMSGIARGDNPDVFHLSELPDFRNPNEDVDASLLNAIHEKPTTFAVMESTAKGKTGRGEWWYEKWKYAKKWFPLNKTRLRPVFLPYFVGLDIYPTKTWAHQFLPKNLDKWEPKEVTKLHAEKCKNYIANSPMLQKYLGVGYELPKHQLYWWEFTRQEFEERGELHKFLEELCSTDEEAFQRSGRGIFSVEEVEWLHHHAKPLALWEGKPAVFGIIGDGISSDDEPAMWEIDDTRSYITVKVDWDNSGGSQAKTYRLIPLYHDTELWNNRLFIYEFPTGGGLFNYACGVDGAEGLEGDGDNSVIEVTKKWTPVTPAEQVAEFASCTLNTAELLPFCLAIGTMYSFVTDDYINQCRQVIEAQFGGFGLQQQLVNAGWGEFHRWHGAYQNIKRKTPNIIGWETNRWTRTLLMTLPVMAIKDGALRIHSPWLIEECSNLQKDSTSNRIEAKGRDHDDRVIACLQSFFSLHDYELLLITKGDPRVKELFTSYGGTLPQREGLLISLNETIKKIEDKNALPGKSLQHIYNNRLPTLD